MLVTLTIEAHMFPLRCHPTQAPLTSRFLLNALPMPVVLQTPKIAGHHIYWHAPFVADAEGATDVMTAPPGTFLFWPERQFLEVTFAPLQAETASVTVLGQLEGDVAPLVALGARLRETHGLSPLTGTLALADGTVAPTSDGEMPPYQDHQISADAAPLAALRAARLALWERAPEGIDTLLASRSVMHPIGPLMFAEAEARTLQEGLWWIRVSNLTPGEKAAMAALACRKAANRLGGLCHLPAAADLLLQAAAALQRGATKSNGDGQRHGRETTDKEGPHTFRATRSAEEADPDGAWQLALLDEAILIASRWAACLDLRIPWHILNEGLRAAGAADHSRGATP